MTKFVSKENLETVVGAVKTKLDSKITDPGNGTAGQILTKTETGTEWATPEEVEQCECEELTEPELDAVMGIINENGFTLNIGDSELTDSYSVAADGTSYTIALVDKTGSNNYTITKVTPSEDWVTVDNEFTKLTVAGRGTEIGDERSCNVAVEVNNKFTKTLTITQGENKETLSVPSEYQSINVSRWVPLEGGMIKPSEIGKCKIDAVYSSGATHTYEFAPCGRDLKQDIDPRFEYQCNDPYHYECNMSNDGIYIERLTDRYAMNREHYFTIHLDWDEKNFAQSYHVSVWQDGYDPVDEYSAATPKK